LLSVTGWQLVAVLLLGSFHGANPAMGWLFATSMGLQERSRRAVLRALPPIAVGHAASVAVFAIGIAVTGSMPTSKLVTIGAGIGLTGFGLWRLLWSRHLRWAGMRLSGRDLLRWSFLMSSVHGAGAMLLPLMTPTLRGTGAGFGSLGRVGAAVGDGLMITAVHALAMVVVAGALAVFVYEVLGVSFLRSAWVNVDRVWACALVGAGVAAVALA
jgi:hypothetical protein